MSDQVQLSIIATECKSACSGEPDFEARILKAMKPVVKGHWMGGDEDVWFRGAIGGVLLSDDTTDDEKERIKFTLRQMRSINALLSGVSVDLNALGDELEREDAPKPVPLTKLWNDAKASPQ